MGVKGLWPLLEPVGRRVNIEALTNKRLAVGMTFYPYACFNGLESDDICRFETLSVATLRDGELQSDESHDEHLQS